MTKGELPDIRDKRIREIVSAWVYERGGDPKKAFPPYPKVSENGPEIRKVRITVKQQRSLMAELPAGWADAAASNHHMAIYRGEDGKISYEVVSLFEAARRLSNQKPIIRKTLENGASLIMSLSPGDTLEFPQADGMERATYRIVTGVWANGQIILEDHTEASGNIWGRPNPRTLLNQNARKVSVDPIGRVRLARD